MNQFGEAWLLDRSGNCIEVYAHPSESFEFESIVNLVLKYGAEQGKFYCDDWKNTKSESSKEAILHLYNQNWCKVRFWRDNKLTIIIASTDYYNWCGTVVSFLRSHSYLSTANITISDSSGRVYYNDVSYGNCISYCMELLSKKFMVCCYFGQSEDLIKAAIDRAYVDMASHTLQYNEFKNDEDGIEEKWRCRYNASREISDGLKKYPLNNDAFDGWHKCIIENVKKVYGNHNLTEGQAQKWLNMTIKYIFVFAHLFGKDFGGLNEINVFLNDTSVDDYKCPIDSYVLKGANIDDVSWSKLDSDNYNETYNEITQIIGCQNSFLWELTNWEEFAKKIKPEKNSYAEYCDIRDTINNI